MARADLSSRLSTLEAVGGIDPDLGTGIPFPARTSTSLRPRSDLAGAPRFISHQSSGTITAGATQMSTLSTRAMIAGEAPVTPSISCVLTPGARPCGWWNIARRYDNRQGLMRLARETRSGAATSVTKKASGVVVAAAPIAVAKHAAVFGMLAWRILRRQTTGRAAL